MIHGHKANYVNPPEADWVMLKKLITISGLMFICSFGYGVATEAAEVRQRVVLGAQPVAGYQYHAGRKVWSQLRVGDALSLVREPENVYDARAIRVEWRGEKLGYVPRAGNEDLAQLMDQGAHLTARIVHLQAGRSHWQRILFEVLLEE